jgi:hypothetical protein
MTPLFCPKKIHQVSFLVCLYRCPVGTKVKCEAYDKIYDDLLTEPVAESYLLKYGTPSYPLPAARRRRRRLQK